MKLAPKGKSGKRDYFKMDKERVSYFPKTLTEIYVLAPIKGSNGVYIDIRVWWRHVDKSSGVPEDVYYPSQKGIAINSQEAAIHIFDYLKEHMHLIGNAEIGSEKASESPEPTEGK